jgi:hypothetical protein
MMPPRQVRGIVVAGLLCAAVAGCGTEVSGSVDAAQPAPSTAAVGCASVSQATMVTVRRTMHPVEPVRVGAVVTTQRKPALVRALFGDFCKVVAHPYAPKTPVHCPAAFDVNYTGTFYDGHRELATFVYGASGCQTVEVTAAGKSSHSLVIGPAANAAPQLAADLAAVTGLPRAAMSGPGPQINPGGPNKPLRQVARLVEVELAVLDAEHERVPLRLGEVELVAVGISGVVHDVKLGFIGLVRRGRGVGGDVYLDPAFLSIDR